jgi:tRNA-binding EMAP/Myf-like protein
MERAYTSAPQSAKRKFPYKVFCEERLQVIGSLPIAIFNIKNRKMKKN